MMHPLFELAKLIAAAVIGMLVTIVHRQYRSERLANPMMDQAQVLLCVSGAMMMIIIGNSVARAFGIAGAASIIRFRTPVEDARDIIILFILMGLGMAAGLGALAVAGLGTVFLCAMIPILNQFSSGARASCSSRSSPKNANFRRRTCQVFAVNNVSSSLAKSRRARSHRSLPDNPPGKHSLEDINAALIGDGKGHQECPWSAPKRS